MKDLITLIQDNVMAALGHLYSTTPEAKLVQIQKTRKDFTGDFTVVAFPLTRYSKKSPADTATDIGNFLKEQVNEINGFNVIKGFLNLEISSQYWLNFLSYLTENPGYGMKKTQQKAPVVIEYSSPNTNKPLHLGHIRNNLLGSSLAKLLRAAGQKVIEVNLVNDRGIHICKSMVAYTHWGNKQKPDDAGKKGDHFVGDFYVKFETEYKKQVDELIEKGHTENEAKKQAPLLVEAQTLLRRWEANDPKVRALWHTMNGWVYQGFQKTYNEMGIQFDKIYYESDVYEFGKLMVMGAVEKNIFYQKDDGSIWVDLSDEKLDEKLLLRGDGTSVYMTQDLGVAQIRHNEFKFDKHIYVVGNEQNYHFKVLKIILKKLDLPWGELLEHFSYGMVELPEGKMKSREGKVVDADDLIDEMRRTTKEMSASQGKLKNLSDEEIETNVKRIAQGALNYFILKVDPKKNMLFNPAESIDFNGNTGTFIQYTYARIRSVGRKAQEQKITFEEKPDTSVKLNEKELNLIKTLYQFAQVLNDAAENLSPAIIANYAYELAREYNQFYHDYSILKETDKAVRDFRMILSLTVAETIKKSLKLLGIETVEQM